MAADTIPPPPGGTGEEPPWARDPKAKAEEASWDDEKKLRGVQLDNEVRFVKVFGWIVPSIMVFFATAFCLTLAIWAWHYLTPWPWLSDDQLSKIQSVVFSGSLGAIVSSYAQKRM